MRQVKAEVHFTVNIDEEDGSYWAEIVEVPGCFVSGRSLSEIHDALTEAVRATVPASSLEVRLPGLALAPGRARRARPRPLRQPAGPAGGRVVPHPALTCIAGDAGGSTRSRDPRRGEGARPGKLVSLAGRRSGPC